LRESQANRNISLCKKAEAEDLRSGKLFRRHEAETIHAHNHLREAKGIKSTKENLEEAINGESYEFQKMYPGMIEDAKAEAVKGALQSFVYANEVEKIHAELYKKALAAMGTNPEVDYYICQVCGNTVEGEAPDECPVCRAKKQAFKKVE
jgi:rubrerythrin